MKRRRPDAGSEGVNEASPIADDPAGLNRSFGFSGPFLNGGRLPCDGFVRHRHGVFFLCRQTMASIVRRRSALDVLAFGMTGSSGSSFGHCASVMTDMSGPPRISEGGN